MRNWINDFPETTALTGGNGLPWNKADLSRQIGVMRAALQARQSPHAPVALLADNSPDWIAIDLATQELGITLVPLPAFFTPAQMTHAIEASGAQALFCMQAKHAIALGFAAQVPCGGRLSLFESEHAKMQADLDDVQKITFTSGTTSEPKGVCLSSGQQWAVARALQGKLAELRIERHLSLLPLPVLLENIAGVYTALQSGATAICPPLSETGLSGAAQFDPHVCLRTIQHYQAQSVILLPQMLQALTAVSQVDDERIRSLKFVAVGGAKTSVALIQAARKKGFPVYEGYGLSECGSVVSLNLPGADRPGSAGRPIPGRIVRIANDGEIEIAGQGVARYLGEAQKSVEWIGTGDLGHLDDDGFLFIDGRKKNVLITAFGRNVSPEWPESALLGAGPIAQAVVFGDAQPYLVAAIVPLTPDPRVVQAAVDIANLALPDYARIRRWISVEPFTPANGLATANGRPRRDAIWQRHKLQIASLYDNHGE